MIRSRPAPAWTVALVLIVTAACAAPSAEPATAGSPGGSASPMPSRPASSPLASEPPAALDGPPEARLAAEGGDPVAGQLGSYVWDQAGSDSPWLPGAPIAVGTGEPLLVEFAAGAGTARWLARYVPATSDGPAGALVLGQGVGPPRFSAPGPGAWTLALDVRFGEGRTAVYAWRLDIP